MSVRPYIRPSTKSLLYSMKFGICGSRLWLMHDGMQYDSIHGQGHGHEPFKVVNPAIFKSYLLRHLQCKLATDHGFLN